MENRFENFTYLILQSSRLIQKIKNNEMKEFGLKAVHVMCIFYLHENPAGLTHGELVKLTLEDKAAVSRAMMFLKERGIVSGGEKKQGNLFKLTKEGEGIAEHIDQAAEKAVAAGGQGLSETERVIFYQSLRSIIQNLTEYYQKTDKDVD